MKVFKFFFLIKTFKQMKCPYSLSSMLLQPTPYVIDGLVLTYFEFNIEFIGIVKWDDLRLVEEH